MTFNKNGWKVVSIAGVTNGGKTSLTKRLIKDFPGSVVINQDLFFRDSDDEVHKWITLSSGRQHQNWELVSAINWKKMESYIREIFTTSPPSILFIEGHLVLNHEPFKEILDRKFFIDLPYEACRERRFQRIYDPADPPGYFEEVVWPMTLRNKEDMRRLHFEGDIIFLDGNGDRESIYLRVFHEMKGILD